MEYRKRAIAVKKVGMSSVAFRIAYRQKQYNALKRESYIVDLAIGVYAPRITPAAILGGRGGMVK